MKVKEKADSFAANYGCMLTPGMRECKPEICGVVSEFKEFFSAVLCVPLRISAFTAVSTQRSRRYAENRREKTENKTQVSGGTVQVVLVRPLHHLGSGQYRNAGRPYLLGVLSQR